MDFNTQNQYENYTIREIFERNIDINIITENVTRCIFCDQEHNVRVCDDTRLLEFEVICTTIFHHVRNQGEFILWLYSYLHRESFAFRLKAFAIRQCGCSEQTTLDQCVNMLCLYMENTYTMGHLEGNEEIDRIRETVTRMESNGREIIEELRLQRSREAILRATEFIIEVNPNANPVKIGYQIIKPTSETKACLCSICWEEKEETKFVSYLCSHEFCGECVLNTLKTKPAREPLKCALCRGKVDFITFHSEETYDELKHIMK
jgi:hypothetical protein